ncbi:MAG: phospholipid carrier-dependent glycosyltransferase [Chloroflexota bacterium]|nr:phospholipid carrier-dependent glycosyltransferase [Chloroflexota bacterium]
MDSHDSPNDAAAARWRDLALFVTIFIVALSIRLFLITTTEFDGLYGQDAYAYYAFALELRDGLAHGQMPPPFFWSLGYPSLLAAGTALLGSSVAVGQMISIFMGAGCAALTSALARQIGCGYVASGFAGLVVAFSGQAIQSSIVLMSDIPALFWALVSANTLLKYISASKEQKSLFTLLLITCLALLFAILTRWLYLVLVPPFLLALLMQRPPLRHVVVALLIVLPFIALQTAHSLTSPYPTLDHPWVTGWSPQHYFQSSFDTPDGHAEYALINAVFYAQPFYAMPYLTPLLTPFIMIGIIRVLNRRDTKDRETQRKRSSVFSTPLRVQLWAVPVLISGWVLLPFLFLAGIPYQNIRFPLILLPPVAILCARGIEIPGRQAHQEQASILFVSRLLSKLFALFLFVSMLLLARDGITYTQAFIAWQVRDKTVVFWVRYHLPEDATLYTHGLSPALRHYTQIEIHELYDETPQSLNTTQHPGAYLLINGWQIANQWAGLAPGVAVDWLLEHRTLRRIGRMSDYTLYLVSP